MQVASKILKAMARTKHVSDELTYADIIGRANERSLAKTGKPLWLPSDMKLSQGIAGKYRLTGTTELFKAPPLYTNYPEKRKLKPRAIEKNWQRLRALSEAAATDKPVKG